MAWYCPTGTADGSQPSRRQRLRRLLRVWALVVLIWHASTKATGLTLKLSAGDTRRAVQPAVHRSLTSCRRPINGDERDATAQPQVPSQTGSTATTRRGAAVAGRLRSPPQHVPQRSLELKTIRCPYRQAWVSPSPRQLEVLRIFPCRARLLSDHTPT